MVQVLIGHHLHGPSRSGLMVRTAMTGGVGKCTIGWVGRAIVASEVRS
ncbi:hypothetical protein SNL152K_3632 [Streptomyces sp. NL15-2K]|nr:hypothetical protein SNL152K_3632 [Streptomyces sp. NL15-2K]